MKKYVCAFGILTFLFVFPGLTLAADALYRMLHADAVESFKADQDALIVGELLGKQGDKFNVKVLRVLSGKVTSATILVDADFTYGWTEAEPAVADFCVLSLKRQGDYYQKAWGIFKADCGDYETLKLAAVNAPTPGLLGDLACIQWYVNSGGKEKDFSFSSGTAYVTRPNGEVLQLYPDPAAEIETTRTDHQPEQAGTKLSRPVLIIIAIILFSGLAAVFLSRGKSNKG
ncbi:MAG: hypothetical protein PHC60_10420 [Heliobacteriaceae bacterium]|nr:hypothetical protein [Heliobacteriaceae bacterium]MDD4588773.1 hypothetical protein [Heliobacteriaceae bacterium]